MPSSNMCYKQEDIEISVLKRELAELRHAVMELGARVGGVADRAGALALAWSTRQDVPERTIAVPGCISSTSVRGPVGPQMFTSKAFAIDDIIRFPGQTRGEGDRVPLGHRSLAAHTQGS